MVSAHTRDDLFCSSIPAVRPVCREKPQKLIVFVPQLTQWGEPESAMNERFDQWDRAELDTAAITQAELTMNLAAAHVVGLTTWARSSI